MLSSETDHNKSQSDSNKNQAKVTSGATSDNDNVIEASGVWKIFGPTPQRALDSILRDGLSKQQVLEKFNCVVGVSDANFSVKEGEIFCIMGLSGSGKSTLVRHVNRLLTPTSGKIMVDGEDVMALDNEALRHLRNQKIAMVFQDFGLMPHRSVFDNVAMALEIRKMPPNLSRAAAEKALAMVELEAWGDKFAHELSGGMQQRVGLARAIAADSKVLLMDEPFSALDPLIRKQLQDEFMQLAKIMNKTTLFITHDLDEAVRIGHRIAIMRDGEIVQIGTAEEIIAAPANEYVSDFVAGISRLNLIKAHSLMCSVAEYEQSNGAISADAKVMSHEAPLELLIKTIAPPANEIKQVGNKPDNPILIEDDDKNIVGVVTKDQLLTGVVAGMA